jgi:hypothetical protein
MYQSPPCDFHSFFLLPTPVLKCHMTTYNNHGHERITASSTQNSQCPGHSHSRLAKVGENTQILHPELNLKLQWCSAQSQLKVVLIQAANLLNPDTSVVSWIHSIHWSSFDIKTEKKGPYFIQQPSITSWHYSAVCVGVCTRMRVHVCG